MESFENKDLNQYWKLVKDLLRELLKPIALIFASVQIVIYSLLPVNFLSYKEVIEIIVMTFLLVTCAVCYYKAFLEDFPGEDRGGKKRLEK
jgi:hypothetical protein